MLESASKLWVVHISNNARLAERARNEGFICVGWTKLGDVSSFDSFPKMRKHFAEMSPNKSKNSVGNSASQLYRFAHEMQIGDAVVYPIKGGRDVMIGEIAGDYQWSDDQDLRDGDYNNIRKVNWLARVPRVRFSQPALRSFGSFSSVSSSDDYLDEVREVLADPEADRTSAADEVESGQETNGSEETEEDAVSAAEEATQATKDYLLRRWSRTAQTFEEVAAAVFRAMGYTAKVQQGTGDLGVDVVAHKDPLGVEPPIMKIQCKSGTNAVGAPALKQLRGTLNPGEKGILISLGGFSKDAFHTEQNDANLILIDSDRFVELFLDNYAKLSPEMRHRFPLQTVYVVAS